MALLPLSTTEFFIAGAPIRIKFIKNSAGAVTELHLQKHFSLWFSAPKSDQPLPQVPVAVDLDPELYDQYMGDYQLGPGLTLTVSVTDGKLFGQATGEAPVELLAKAEDNFFLEGADVQIEFTRDAAGRVTGLVLQQSGQAMPGQKVK